MSDEQIMSQLERMIGGRRSTVAYRLASACLQTRRPTDSLQRIARRHLHTAWGQAARVTMQLATERGDV